MPPPIRSQRQHELALEHEERVGVLAMHVRGRVALARRVAGLGDVDEVVSARDRERALLPLRDRLALAWRQHYRLHVSTSP